MEQMRCLADEFKKSCPDGEQKILQGNSLEAVFVILHKSCDTLTTTVNEKHKMLQQHIALWQKYNNLKEAVLTIINDVQCSIDELKERSHDPTIAPTAIVDSANVCVYLSFMVLCV